VASIVLVGMHQEEIDPAAWPDGTHFLGARSYDVLPAYVQAFDVGLVPYVHNAHTAAVDPLKVLEYLAAGIPVVSTGLREVQKYATVVEVADGGSAFADAVARALDARTPADRAARQAVAAQHTWERRVQTFLSYIDDLPFRRLPG
jgi:glycosyltransferase involved in cell wall biosynthesis